VLFKTSDDELMVRLATGDPSAFRSLFDRHGTRLLGYCSRFMGDTTRGEDMAQDVWMKAIRSAPQYRAEGKFVGWLLSLARNTCLSEMRKHSGKIELPSEHIEEIADSTIDRESIALELDRQKSVERLKRKIEALPTAQRISLVLWMSDEQTYEQIAAQMEISVPAVKSLLFRARQSLEKAMRADT